MSSAKTSNVGEIIGLVANNNQPVTIIYDFEYDDPTISSVIN